MRVLFVLPRMLSGGVERVTLNLIKGFVAEGHECRLALRRAHGELLPEARALVAIDEVASGGMHRFVPTLARVIKEWQPTHIVTAFPDVAALTWAAARIAKSTARWVQGVHNTHARITMQSGLVGRFRQWLDTLCSRFVYRRADAIVTVSEGVRTEVLDWFHIPPGRVATIYNPVVSDIELAWSRHYRPDDQAHAIVAIGRLTRQKGFDVLIHAMAQVPPPWRLDIWGEGPERERLQAQIDQEGLAGSISLRGYTNRPFEVLRKADLFVLSSRFEGFALVVVEALACQCQVVATDCPHGPREILGKGRLGQLVAPDDPTALGNAIVGAIRGKVRFPPSDLLRRAHDFSIHESCRAWIRFLEECSEDGRERVC